MRLTSGERRKAIIRAVRAIFADKGFDGTTTKELAAAAGVSKALLFKHFPDKASLYDSVIDSCSREPGFAEIAFNRFLGLKPSAASLVVMVHFMITHFVKCREFNRSVMDRLAVQSLLADGEFLRRTISKVADTWIRKFEECLSASSRNGDLRKTPVRPDLRFWFTHHIAFSLLLHLDLPEDPALNYMASTDKLIEQAVWFALSGIGLKEETIRRNYTAKALAAYDKVAPKKKRQKKTENNPDVNQCLFRESARRPKIIKQQERSMPMKKTILLLTTFVFAFTLGSAFAADKADSKASAPPYNGITYFDVGTASTQQDSVVIPEEEASAKPYNGITYFDLGQAKSAKGSAAGGSAAGQAPEKKPYNGITAF